MVTDRQVRKLMEEHEKTGSISRAAAKADMDRKTAAKYITSGKLPSQLKSPRTWRTREDPFADHWSTATGMLEHAPELEAKALFEHLMATTGRYVPGQLRTFQRRVRQWRARHGPDKEVFFSQVHIAGEALQTDFTHCTELGITIAGEAFPHLLCHCVLPHSNWGWATVCQSESMAALRNGVQNAVFRLGRIPTWHQTDNSTAATHNIPSGKRGFNKAYADFMDHIGMKPRTIGIGESEQNGDVEALNGALKNRLRQHLLLRGSSDFDDVAAYVAWLHTVLEAANQLRGKRFQEEHAAMRPLVAKRLLDYTTVDVGVSSWSTIRVMNNAYSLPSRLIRETVRVRIFEDRLEVWHGDSLQAKMPRLNGRNGNFIDYRHIIFWLVRKPGAFARYRYRESLFPTLNFRRTYDALIDVRAERPATLEYLRILNLAATTFEAEIDTALGLLLEQGVLPTDEAVRELVRTDAPPPPVEIEPFEPELGRYDGLVGGVACR